MTDVVEESPICPSCEQAIPLERFALHLDGLDGARPECPRTDLLEVAERARAEAGRQERRRRWSLVAHPWSRTIP